MKRSGGKQAAAAGEVLAIIGAINTQTADPFHGVRQTKHGESRIPNCIKYDLTGFCRLVTVLYGHVHILVYAGSHEDEERWLNNNRGLTFGVDNDNRIIEITVSGNSNQITAAPDTWHGKLLDRLDPNSRADLFGDLPARDVEPFRDIEAGVSSEKIGYYVQSVGDENLRLAIYDVLIKLNAGNVDGARDRIALLRGDIKPISSFEAEDYLKIQDGESVKQIKIGSPEYEVWIKSYIDANTYYDWFLFMHPEQEKYIDEDYEGPARLSGVSGSGKTCIAIRRAIRLAQAGSGKKIGLITLNRSLAALISKLADSACPNPEVRSRIEVYSFFRLCQVLLSSLDAQNSRRYSDVTWKLEEHIDEIFREYYRGVNNYTKSDVMIPTHYTLVAQGVDAESYIKEEFDWIRSALPFEKRDEYLAVERKGRGLPLDKDRRSQILSGLSYWEEKMEHVGIIDYMGLSTAVTKFRDLGLHFDHLIIDEAQDFGTTELSILRKLVPEGKNDIFLCGDLAQHILPKHQRFSDAGIETANRSYKIRRNYRNSREILKAAYGVLYNNLNEAIFDKGDLEILDPQYANRSSAEPIVLSAPSLEGEIRSAIALMRENENMYKQKGAKRSHSGCIAFAGFTQFEISLFAQQHGLPVLDGAKEPADGELFLSDLEQTKGYEFDTVVILNCRKGALPPAGTPVEDAFRFGAQLYVAMTRAKEQLVLSFSGTPSDWLTNRDVGLSFDTWDNYVDVSLVDPLGEPGYLPEQVDIDDEANQVMLLNGRQFLYTPYAWGMPPDLQIKLEEVVPGEARQRAGRRVAWKNVGQLLEDIELGPARGGTPQVFGPKADQLIREMLEKARSGVRPIARRPVRKIEYTDAKPVINAPEEHRAELVNPVIDPRDIPLGELNLSARLFVSLHEAKVRTLGDLIKSPLNEIARRANLRKQDEDAIQLVINQRIRQWEITLLMKRADTLDVTSRTKRVLKANGLTLLADVANIRISELLKNPECGRREILELQRALSKYNIVLRP